MSDLAALGGWIKAVGASGLRRNSVFAGGQALVAILCMFAVYRVVLASAGLERMGLWSLLAAGSAAARLADVSGASGLGRFVAERRGQADLKAAAIYIHTVIISSLLINIAIGGVLYAISGVLIDRLVDAKFSEEARTLVPFVILSTIILSPASSGLCSAVDGLRRADIRSIIVSISLAVLFAATVVAVPAHGLIGFAVAMVVQQVVTIVGCWLVLSRHLPALGAAPYRWSNEVFRETFGFGVKLQFNGLAALLSDPLAKAMINHWGGLAAVAIYELAARLILSLRGIVVQAFNTLIPEFAARRDDRGHTVSLIRRSVRIASISGLGISAAVILVSPIFSHVMLGRVDPTLLTMIAVLGVGYAINTISVPFYFAGLSNGVMLWNFLAHAALAASTIVLGSILGAVAGPIGVVAAVVIGLWGGAAVTAVGNARSLGFLNDLKPMAIPLASVSAVIVLTGVIAWAVIEWGVRH